MRVNEYKCKKCDHEWFSTMERKPRVCPRCKTYNWEVIKNEN